MTAIGTSEDNEAVPTPPADRVGEVGHRTIGQLLLDTAEATPERPFLRFDDGEVWTWVDSRSEALRACTALQSFGVGPGDRVGILLPNGPSWFRAWWGSALAGAVLLPINLAYQGQMLEDLLERGLPKVVIADDNHAEAARRCGAVVAGAEVLTEQADRDVVQPDALPPVSPWDVHAIVHTSGTTGASKGSLTTHVHMATMSAWLRETGPVTSEDVWLGDLPLFHLAALVNSTLMMRVGGGIAVRSAPDLRGYWNTVRETGATWALTVGTMAEFLMRQPPSPADTSHGLRFITCVPRPADEEGFKRRFGLNAIVTSYGSTEANVPICQGPSEVLPTGSCGRVRQGFEVRLVDENDIEVPIGTVGEAIVRCDEPWYLSTGYFGDAEATTRAWRNGWFHTGDGLRCDAEGYFHFVDRVKDAIRRRGENISNFEVEREVLAHPDVAEAACIAAPSPIGGDDEVKVFIVVSGSIDLIELWNFLAARMPHFMVPRYLEVLDELPKTPTSRVKKHELRSMGNSVRTWDSEEHGLRATRRGVVRSPTSRFKPG